MVQVNRYVLMLIPLSLLFLLSQFYRAVSAVIASELMNELLLTAEDMGLLSSVFFYAFALIQIPMGIAMDRFGAKRLILVLSSLGIGGTASFALANSFSVALIGRAFMGIGMACALMGTYKFISVWFPSHSFATISGIILSFGTLGNVAATAPLAIAVDWMGWRNAFLLVAFIHLLITFWVYLVVEEGPNSSKKSIAPSSENKSPLKESIEGILLVVTLPSFWLISLATFVRYGTYISIAGLWAGPYLEYVHGVSLIDRGKILMLFPLGFLLGGPIFGFLSDRIFRNRKIVAVLGMFFYTAFIFPLVGLFHISSLTLVAVIFGGIGFSVSFGMIMYANIKELLPESISGTAMSAVNFFTMAGAGFFQHVMGAVVERFSFNHGQLPPEAFSFAFGLCFVSSALGALAYLFVKERHS